MTPSLCEVYVPKNSVDKLDDGSEMIGNFTGGDGYGKRLFRNGHVWQGNFKGCMLNGEGEHILPKREAIHSGQFENSRLKTGTITYNFGFTKTYKDWQLICEVDSLKWKS